MNTHYDHAAIEAKWQRAWEESKVFKVDSKADSAKKGPKFYCLDMFPYLSGAGLHIGHPVGYTGTDVYCRFMRSKGYQVLHPMGFDAFGLPTEQQAVKSGIHPAEITKQNEERFLEQLKRIGFSYDWDRCLKTCDESYYRWTQWIFLKMFNSYYDKELDKARPIDELTIPAQVEAQGAVAVAKFRDEHRLAYQSYAMVNYCPELGTVLANEEVIDGKSERGGFDVIRKPMKQWMLRITAYADRLLDDLEELDWPEAIKEQQRNWINKSYGANIKFRLEGSDETIEVFTTRIDTIAGVTFLVLAPEHPLVDKITTSDCQSAIGAYKEASSAISERDRTMDNREKTGEFTGAFAINPITGDLIPVFVADYVLSNYGTGAVMGVPAHDARDFEFIKTLKKLGHNVQIVTAIVHDLDAPVPEGELLLGYGYLRKDLEIPVIKSLGLLGASTAEALEKLPAYLETQGLGQKVIQYRLRDWLFSRQRYWGEPIPIIHREDGITEALREEDLPLTLPYIEEYQSLDGQSPLAGANEWVNVTCSDGVRGKRETDTMPQWAGSCWYYLRFLDPHNDGKFVDPVLEKEWMNVDLYVGGAEHAVLHLLYSRFWHKVLFDLGYVSTKEPFKKLFNQGLLVSHAFKNKTGQLIPVDLVKQDGAKYIHTETGEELEKIMAKMSKSLKNVVDPLHIVEQYGADTLRMYLMFTGPLDSTRPWDDKAIVGVNRFLKRLYAFVAEDNFGEDSDTAVREINILVKKCSEEYANLRVNTSIAALMECFNAISKCQISKASMQKFVQILAPIAPHLADELWEKLGGEGWLVNAPWPEFDESKTQSLNYEMVIQVAGKKKGALQITKESDDEIMAMVSEFASSKGYNPKQLIPVRDKGNNNRIKLVNIIA